jgi:hypothetical protein
MLIVLAPVATAVDIIVAVATAAIATSVAVNITSSITTTNNTNTTPTDYYTTDTANRYNTDIASNNTRAVSTDIANTIASWNTLSQLVRHCGRREGSDAGALDTFRHDRVSEWLRYRHEDRTDSHHHRGQRCRL